MAIFEKMAPKYQKNTVNIEQAVQFSYFFQGRSYNSMDQIYAELQAV